MDTGGLDKQLTAGPLTEDCTEHTDGWARASAAAPRNSSEAWTPGSLSEERGAQMIQNT